MPQQQGIASPNTEVIVRDNDKLPVPRNVSAWDSRDMKVFVYGTLKSGMSNHQRVQHLKKLGDGYITGFSLVHQAAFPALFRDFVRPYSTVHGEVYEITDRADLEALDRFENVGSLYNRERVMVRVREVDRAKIPEFGWCDTYTQNPPSYEYRRILSGIWEGNESKTEIVTVHPNVRVYDSARGEYEGDHRTVSDITGATGYRPPPYRRGADDVGVFDSERGWHRRNRERNNHTDLTGPLPRGGELVVIDEGVEAREAIFIDPEQVPSPEPIQPLALPPPL